MINLDLFGKIALVTGANGGLGSQICIDLAECGADLVIAVRNKEKAFSLRDDIIRRGRKALIVEGDISKSKDVKAISNNVIEYYGRSVDILVNNAGHYNEYSPIVDISDEVLDRTIDTNLKGTFYMCREFGKGMMDFKINGRIINICSGAGHGGRKNHSHYSASKAGIRMMTKSIAIEMAPSGINVNSISVGFIDVGRFDDGDLLTVKKDILPRILLRRPGKPRDISGLICYLSSEFGDWITGTDFRIDGGESSGRVPYEIVE